MENKRKRRQKRSSHKADSSIIAMAQRDESDRKAASMVRTVHQYFVFFAYLATLVYLFSIPIEKAFEVEGIGTISRALGVPLLALWMIALLLNPMYLRAHKFFVATALFVIWIGLTRYWAISPESSDFFLQTYIQLFLSSLCIWLALTNEVKCRWAMQALLAGAWWAVVVIWYNYQTGNLTGGRATIESVDQNEISLVLAMCIVVAIYLITEQRKSGRANPLMSLLNLAFIPAALLAILMTGSRGGTLACLPAFLFMLINFHRAGIGTKIVLGVLVVASTFFILQNLPEAQIERISTTQEELESGDIGGRGELWRNAYELWSSDGETMVVGIGSGSFIAASNYVAHNTHLSVLTETGLVGFFIYTAILTILLLTIGRAGSGHVKLFLVSLLMSWAIGATALTWEYRKPTWVVWTLILCVAVSSRKQAQSIVSAPVKKRKRRRPINDHY